MSNKDLPRPNNAVVRCLDQSGLPDYATTYGTELCLVPHLMAFSRALAEEGEQVMIKQNIQELERILADVEQCMPDEFGLMRYVVEK